MRGSFNPVGFLHNLRRMIMAERLRQSFTKEERRQAWETTTIVAKQKLGAERQARDEKTRRLREARLAFENGQRRVDISNAT
jgi:hypothetical protein